MNDLTSNIFRSIETEDYVVLKLNSSNDTKEIVPEFDLLCNKIQIIKERIILAANYWINEKKIVKFKHDSPLHLYIDFFDNENLILRLDIYEDFPILKNIILRNSFKDVVLKTRTRIELEGVALYTPKIEYDHLIRYVEYVELFDKRNDKIKHLEYLEKSISNPQDFFNALHFFVKFPAPRTPNKRKINKDDIKDLIEKIKQTPIKQIVPKGIKFLKNVFT